MGNDDDFGVVVFCIFVGFLIGILFYWGITVSYLPDFHIMMQHGIYAIGMGFLTIFVIIGYFEVNKEYILVFTSLWLCILALWILFAYAIYDITNLFLIWWGSNLSFNTAFILVQLAMAILCYWGIREMYYKKVEADENKD